MSDYGPLPFRHRLRKAYEVLRGWEYTLEDILSDDAEIKYHDPRIDDTNEVDICAAITTTNGAVSRIGLYFIPKAMYEDEEDNG